MSYSSELFQRRRLVDVNSECLTGKALDFAQSFISSTASCSAHGEMKTSVITERRSIRLRLHSGTHELRGLRASGTGWEKLFRSICRLPPANGSITVNHARTSQSWEYWICLVVMNSKALKVFSDGRCHTALNPRKLHPTIHPGLTSAVQSREQTATPSWPYCSHISSVS